MMRAVQDSPARLDRLDHLRAAAAVMVLMWHVVHAWLPYSTVPSFPLFSLFEEGHTGVSLFCVISGFIFTHLYFDLRIGYREFIKKRILRVAPLFVVFAALSFYVSDWDLTQFVMMFATGLVRGGLPSYVGPGWSVLIEFQFYLLFPFLLAFVRSYGLRYLVGVLGAVLLLRALVFIQRETVQDIAYYSIFGRIDQFVFGMLAARLATLAQVRSVISKPLVNALVFAGALGVFSLFYQWFNLQGGLMELHGQAFPAKSGLWVVLPTIEGLFYATILVTYLHLPAIPGLGWFARGVAYIGVVSYSIYLSHLLVFKAANEFVKAAGFDPRDWTEATLAFFGLGLPLFVAVASVTYYVIERPFLRLKSGLPAKRLGASWVPLPAASKVKRTHGD